MSLPSVAFAIATSKGAERESSPIEYVRHHVLKKHVHLKVVEFQL